MVVSSFSKNWDEAQNRKLWLDRVLCLMLIVVSGNPAVTYFYMPAVIILPAIILGVIAFLRKIRITERDLWIATGFALLFIAQLAIFGSQVISPSISFMFKLLTGLLAVKVIKNFDKRLIEVMVALSLISLVFFAPVLFGVDMASLVRPIAIPFVQNNIQPSIDIGIHNYRIEVGDLHRNSGMFWEPGAFAGYIILTMLFLLKTNGSRSAMYFFVLTIALITTQSTTGYLVFPLVIIVYLWNRSKQLSIFKRNFARIFYITTIVAGVSLAYVNFSFLEQKVVSQMINAENEGAGWQLTRFGNALYDFHYISRRPLLGWSLSDKTRGETDKDILTRQGNGLTGSMVRFGMLGFLMYVAFVYRSFQMRFNSTVIAISAVVVINFLLMGEQFLFYPLFLSLMFLTRKKCEVCESNPLTVNHPLLSRKTS